jgi:hypothetical protein
MMDQSKRQRLQKEQRALLLGGSDMRQAAAAARTLEHEQDVNLARALETAMTVCFMRPFTRSDLQVPKRWWPTGQDATHLDEVKAHRDKVYAHTDVAGGRWAETVEYTTGGARIGMHFQEGWNAMNRAVVADFVALCKRLEDEFMNAAAAIQLVLDGHEFQPDS